MSAPQAAINRLIDEVANEFIRLEVSACTDGCEGSGLMSRDPNVFDHNDPSVPIVEIYDDYANGFYDGTKLLALLKGIKAGETSVDSEDNNNIWQLIQGAEI